MQLREIALTHQLKDLTQRTWNHTQALKNILSRHGWKSLGTGSEAAVAMHPE